MDNKTFTSLEFPLIKAKVSNYCMTTLAQEKAVSLKPKDSIKSIEASFENLKEFELFESKETEIDFSKVCDVRPFFKTLGPRDSYLSSEELLNLLQTIDTFSFLKNCPLNDSLYKNISKKLATLETFKEIHEEIDWAVDIKGDIKDKASPALFEIRKSIYSFKDKARKILEKIVKSKEGIFSEKEPYTISDDRYVLRVKASYNKEVKGVIHGKSSTGQTFVIEPVEVFEINNALSVLKKDERAEVVRILISIANLIRENKKPLEHSYFIACEIDLIQALYLFKKHINGTVPLLTQKGDIKLVDVKHPILVFNEMAGAGRVTSISLDIKEKDKVLIISGANAGGKTALLKTLGLQTLMSLSGIPICAKEGTVIRFFKKIYSDIGDSQSISDSLSTFSAHLTRSGEILNNADNDSLVLMDEIGVGTDPKEGGALSLAILKSLRDKGALTLVTTHLNVLKAYSELDEDFTNASVEFDSATKKPLYTLSYGIPGESYALEAAAKYGIPAEVVASARESLLSTKEGEFIESLSSLKEEKDKYKQLNEKLLELKEKRDESLAYIRENRKVLIDKGKKKIKDVIEKAEKDIEDTIKNLKKKNQSDAKKAKQKLKSIKETVKPIFKEKIKNYIPKLNEKVGIIGTSTEGIVIKIEEKDKKAILSIGGIKMTVPFSKIAKISEKEPKKTKKPQKSVINVQNTEVSLSLNLIGKRVEEAMQELERFIDNCHMQDVAEVTIIHGLGTGILKKAVAEYLKNSPLIKKTIAGDEKKAGPGATVAILN